MTLFKPPMNGQVCPNRSSHIRCFRQTSLFCPIRIFGQYFMCIKDDTVRGISGARFQRMSVRIRGNEPYKPNVEKNVETLSLYFFRTTRTIWLSSRLPLLGLFCSPLAIYFCVQTTSLVQFVARFVRNHSHEPVVGKTWWHCRFCYLF